MPAPTFLGIGVQKCGTTWLARAVQQHPQVATGATKELQFFNHREAYARGLGWYEEQFRVRRRTRAIGEFTPNYWWTVGTTTANNYLDSAGRIADAYPDLRLVVCLRHPVDRAVSAYFHHMRAGRYPPSTGLLEAVDRYPDVREFGDYGTQLAAWLRRFPLDRFLVLVYEDDIRPDAAKLPTLRRVFTHLGVRPGFEPTDLTLLRNQRATHFDIRFRHASPWQQRAMRAIPPGVRTSARWTIPVAYADRAALADHFRPEVARLEGLLGRAMPWDLDA
ncbi:sulfotransferase [Nocardioides sp.]|uniref:sulfotransferase family protein n=1 Tax=Nocardioides sp. TaxID=35761 RepID=UPI002720C846|nr:sulfotransferase [Nocardioides sp.]MDO9455722.1 sulfotransferase [Nocardioides sp.]